MKITKKELVGRLEYLYNVTGIHYELSCQSSGKGKGYSIMYNGSHVMTFGHVPAAELDACITSYARGYYKCVQDFAPKGL